MEGFIINIINIIIFWWQEICYGFIQFRQLDHPPTCLFKVSITFNQKNQSTKAISVSDTWWCVLIVGYIWDFSVAVVKMIKIFSSKSEAAGISLRWKIEKNTLWTLSVFTSKFLLFIFRKKTLYLLEMSCKWRGAHRIGSSLHWLPPTHHIFEICDDFRVVSFK